MLIVYLPDFSPVVLNIVLFNRRTVLVKGARLTSFLHGFQPLLTLLREQTQYNVNWDVFH
jgi:hypothetical protein